MAPQTLQQPADVEALLGIIWRQRNHLLVTRERRAKIARALLTFAELGP